MTLVLLTCATVDANHAHHHTAAFIFCADDIRGRWSDGMGRHWDDLDVLLRYLGGAIPVVRVARSVVFDNEGNIEGLYLTVSYLFLLTLTRFVGYFHERKRQGY